MIDISVSTAILVAGLFVIVLYFSLLSRKMGALTPEQRKKFSEKSDDIGNLLSVLPLAVAFSVDDLVVKFVLMLIGLLLLQWQTHVHHQRLVQRGFNPVFVGSVARLSLLVVLGLGLILVSNVVGTNQSVLPYLANR
jgi:hypothetical protein